MNPDPFAAVLAELHEEHGRAVSVHGFDAEHDARHSDADWAWRLLRRISEVMAPETIVPSTADERRRAFVEVAHIAASAVAAHDLRTARAKVEADGRGVLEVPHVLHHGWATGMADRVGVPPLVTSTDASSRYVTRPGADYIERHTLACAAWRASPEGPCLGECSTIPTPEETPA